MDISKELFCFKVDFATKTHIKIASTIEERTFFHWKRLVFQSLNCEEMATIAKYIKDTFSTPGKYSHILPKLGSYNGCLTLTVHREQIEEFIMK